MAMALTLTGVPRWLWTRRMHSRARGPFHSTTNRSGGTSSFLCTAFPSPQRIHFHRDHHSLRLQTASSKPIHSKHPIFLIDPLQANHCVPSISSTRRWYSNDRTTSKEKIQNETMAVLENESPKVVIALDEMKNKELSAADDDAAGSFKVTAPYDPTGDQPEAIAQLVHRLERGDKYSILRGITGTGKTLVMAHTIAKLQRKTLVLCHNKTLAAQLARELRSFFKENHVELFVSFYNMYVPEYFKESTNKYNAKKSVVSEELDALRHLATTSLLQYKDVVVVASVSCIFGLGMPKEYLDASLQWTLRDTFPSIPHIDSTLQKLLYVDIQEANAESRDDDDGGNGKKKKKKKKKTKYRPIMKNDNDLVRGRYEMLTNPMDGITTLTLWPPSEMFPMRTLFKNIPGTADAAGNMQVEITSIARGQSKGFSETTEVTIFPAKHHITTSEDQLEESCRRIEDEMHDRIKVLRDAGKNLEADRLNQKVTQDLLMLKESGFCAGIENYSRHLALRAAGEAPDCLLDYFSKNWSSAGRDDDTKPDDWLLMVDESHVTLPQIKAMYRGDRARKKMLVKHGYRLPSALDNRPLKEDEFFDRIQQGVFVSATPSKQEFEMTTADPVEMIIRPTYVCDPIIEVRPSGPAQLTDLLDEIKKRIGKNERTLAMTLTKRDSEDLAEFLNDNDVSSTYLHSDLSTQERAKALEALQSGNVDCLVGVNLLREGIDLPQVSLVAILNADSQGFLRSETALLQTIGRAARNIHGTAILYANRITPAMKACIDTTKTRRKVQQEYNAEHGKTMRTTSGSSVQPIFDLLKDQIEAARPLEIVPSQLQVRKELRQSMNLPDSIAVPISTNMDGNIQTDHIPGKPGVYFWKDASGNILYIGKAKTLRSRVKSYLSPGAKHSTRIRVMLEKAKVVEFILTPSDRDALLLESNLIKHHQPPYNVLLKDDKSYPYICASLQDAFPRLSVVPRKHEGDSASAYKYYGPYPHYSEISHLLEAIEEKYKLRVLSFQARLGSFSKTKYSELFGIMLEEVFENNNKHVEEDSLTAMRSEYEEASHLFESQYNDSRDIVAIQPYGDTSAVVQVIQLRQGLVAGKFAYICQLPSGMASEDDHAAAVQTVLEKQHYPSGEKSIGDFSFFPDEILLQCPLIDEKELKSAIKIAVKAAEPDRKNKTPKIRKVSIRGPRKETDKRAMQLAVENAQDEAQQQSFDNVRGAARTSLDGTAAAELQSMLGIDTPIRRIECYDISHTQGVGSVGSRVVFLDGRPAPNLYRRFNIKTVAGNDDYASLEEVLARRFRYVVDENKLHLLVDADDEWAAPDLVVIDGGRGQLHSAIKGMEKVGVSPYSSAKNHHKEVVLEEQPEDLIIEEEYANDLSAHYGNITTDSVPIVSLAKQREEVFVMTSQHPVNETPDSPALLLLRSLRDESHRFALKNHRKRRSKLNGLPNTKK